MSLKSVFLLAFSINAFTCLSAQEQKASTPFSYRVETSVSVADGRYAPLWFTANRYGLSSQEPKSAYLRAGVQWQKEWQHGWRVQAGADLAGGKNRWKESDCGFLCATGLYGCCMESDKDEHRE